MKYTKDHLDKALQSIGIKKNWWMYQGTLDTLDYLYTHEGCSIKEACDAANTSSATVTKCITRIMTNRMKWKLCNTLHISPAGIATTIKTFQKQLYQYMECIYQD